jgi:hypothetical protein
LEWYGRTVVGRKEARWWWCCSAALASRKNMTPDRVRSFDSLDRSCTFKIYAVFFSSQLATTYSVRGCCLNKLAWWPHASSQLKLTRLTDSQSTHDHTRCYLVICPAGRLHAHSFTGPWPGLMVVMVFRTERTWPVCLMGRF